LTEQRQAFDKACRTLSLSPHAKEVEFMNIEKAITAFESNGFKVEFEVALSIGYCGESFFSIKTLQLEGWKIV